MLISKAVKENKWQGVQMGKHAPHISHLFFVDDCLLFAKADSQNLQSLQRTLSIYEKVFSGHAN